MWFRPVLLTVFLMSFVLAPFELAAQSGAKIKTDNYARWVLRPAAYPYFAAGSKYVDETGASVIDVESHGAEGFLRISRYRPGGGLEYGLDLGFSQRYDLLRHATSPELAFASYTESSFVGGPMVSYARDNIRKKNHPKISLGLYWRYAADRVLRYNEPGAPASGARLTTDLPFLRRSSFTWQLGLGNLKERFSLFRRTNKPSELSFFASLPLFDQADQVATDYSEVPSNTISEAFRGLRRESVHFGGVYTELVDLNRNGLVLKPDEVMTFQVFDSTRNLRLLSPLVGGTPPRRRLEGVFSFMGTYQQGIERIDSNEVTTEVLNLRPSVGWRLGYSLHFGFNRKNYFGRPGTDGYLEGAKALVGVFIGGGIGQQVYRFNSPRRYASFRQTIISGEAGLRVGGVRGVMFFVGGGYRRSLALNRVYEELPPVELTELENLYFFGGLLLRDLVVVRVNTGALKVASGLEVEGLNLGVGVGF